MRIYVTLALLSIFQVVSGQNTIDSLEHLLDSLKFQRTSINTRIADLENALEQTLIANRSESDCYEVKSGRKTRMYTTYAAIDTIKTINKGVALCLLDRKSRYILIKELSSDVIGWVSSSSLSGPIEEYFKAMNDAKIEKERLRHDSLKVIQDARRDSVFLTPYNVHGVGISLFGAEISSIDNAGGVSTQIRFGHLLKGKTIKYFTATVNFYNAVGDILNDEIRGVKDVKLVLTGPVPYTGEIEIISGDTVFYGETSRCIKIKRIDIEYLDGTKGIYINDLPKTYMLDFKNDCTQ